MRLIFNPLTGQFDFVGDGGTSGGSALGVMVWDEGIPLGTGSILNFVGDNVLATISGSVVRVYVTGSATAFPPDMFWTSGSLGINPVRIINPTNPQAIGDYAFSIGQGNIVSGVASFAWGTNNRVIGEQSQVGGFNNQVYGNVANALGANGTVSGTLTSINAASNGVVIGNVSAILGGSTGRLVGDRSVLLGGLLLSKTGNDTVFVPKLNIDNVQPGVPLTWLAIASNGYVISGSLGIQNEGIHEGNVMTLNFVGSQISATVSGTNARILVDLSGFVTGSYALLDGRYQPSGTANFITGSYALLDGRYQPSGTIDLSPFITGSYTLLDGKYQPTGTTIPYAGFISENSAYLTYITGTSYQVEAGSAEVNGVVLIWDSPIVRTGLTLTSGTMPYVYLYTSGTATAAIEESTTIPVWDNTLNYFKKTGDNSRRCIGFVQAATVNTIRTFINNVKTRTSEVWYIDEDTGVAKIPINFLNSLATGTIWGQVDGSTILPIHAQDALLIGKLVLGASGDDGTLGMSPWDMGALGANIAPYQTRGRASAANANIFSGNTWLTLKVPQKFYYKLLANNQNPRAQIEIHGVRFIR